MLYTPSSRERYMRHPLPRVRCVRHLRSQRRARVPERRSAYPFILKSRTCLGSGLRLSLLYVRGNRLSPRRFLDLLCTPQRPSVPHATTALSRRSPAFFHRCDVPAHVRAYVFVRSLHPSLRPTLRGVFWSCSMSIPVGPYSCIKAL